MKRFLGLVILMSLFFIPLVVAKEQAKETAEQSSPAAPVIDEAKMAKKRKMIEEKKAELNGTQWEVTMTPSGGKDKPEQDELTFQNGQVSVKSFSSRGFTPTNYTITLPDGGDMTIWETMQTNPKEGVVFIRGEWEKDKMRGVISQQIEGGKTKDYSFVSASKTAVSPDTSKKEDKDKNPASPEQAASSDASAKPLVDMGDQKPENPPAKAKTKGKYSKSIY